MMTYKQQTRFLMKTTTTSNGLPKTLQQVEHIYIFKKNRKKCNNSTVQAILYT